LAAGGGGGGGEGSKSSRGSWLQRHLSLKRGKKSGRNGGAGAAAGKSLDEGLESGMASRSGSAPLLITVSSPPSTPGAAAKSFRRPSCVDGVVAVSIVPGPGAASAATAGKGRAAVIPEERQAPPPQILATDFDLELETPRF